MRILLVDDDPTAAAVLRAALVGEGHQVDVAGSALEAQELADGLSYSVVILDLSLPDQSGLSMLRDLRQRQDVPVIIVSGVVELDAKLNSLSAGADDYVTKPFHLREVIARIEAVVRRADRGDTELLSAGSLTLDVKRGTLRICDVPIHITPTEFAILEQLLRCKGRLVIKENLAGNIHGSADERSLRLLSVFISQLRRKLASAGEDPIQTVWGQGYIVRATSGDRLKAAA